MVSGMRVLISMSDGSNSITPFCCSSNLQGHIAAVNKQAREGGGQIHTHNPLSPNKQLDSQLLLMLATNAFDNLHVGVWL